MSFAWLSFESLCIWFMCSLANYLKVNMFYQQIAHQRELSLILGAVAPKMQFCEAWSSSSLEIASAFILSLLMRYLYSCSFSIQYASCLSGSLRLYSSTAKSENCDRSKQNFYLKCNNKSDWWMLPLLAALYGSTVHTSSLLYSVFCSHKQ